MTFWTLTSTEEQLGKPIGSDQEEGKFTFVNLLGVDGALAYAKRCTEEAKSALRGLQDTQFLEEFGRISASAVKIKKRLNVPQYHAG